jgi:hypothetical protein
VRPPAGSVGPHPAPRRRAAGTRPCKSARDAAPARRAGCEGRERECARSPEPQPRKTRGPPDDPGGKGRAERLRSFPNSAIQQRRKLFSRSVPQAPAGGFGGRRICPESAPRLWQPEAESRANGSAIRKICVAEMKHAAWKRHVRVRSPPHPVNREKEAKPRSDFWGGLHRVLSGGDEYCLGGASALLKGCGLRRENGEQLQRKRCAPAERFVRFGAPEVCSPFINHCSAPLVWPSAGRRRSKRKRQRRTRAAIPPRRGVTRGWRAPFIFRER